MVVGVMIDRWRAPFARPAPAAPRTGPRAAPAVRAPTSSSRRRPPRAG